MTWIAEPRHNPARERTAPVDAANETIPVQKFPRSASVY
jgi:hypothetical protein